MFLKDRVIPDNIDDFIINKKPSSQITKLLNNDFIENLLVYGPQGCGKYTLVIKALEKMVGKPIVKTNRFLLLNNSWGNIKEANVPCSEYHFEINLSKYGHNRNNIFSIIDELCSSEEINKTLPYRIILIRNLHQANLEIIKFIKQKAEIYNEKIKFLMLTKTNSNIIKLLSGVFFTLRVPSPNKEDIKSVLKLNKVKFDKQLDTIISNSNRNLSIILSQLEIRQLTSFYKTATQSKAETIIKFLKERKLSSLGEIRSIIYEYQTANEDLDLLIITISRHFLDLGNIKFPVSKKVKLTSLLANYNSQKINSFKEIVHIETILFNLFKLIHTN